MEENFFRRLVCHSDLIDLLKYDVVIYGSQCQRVICAADIDDRFDIDIILSKEDFKSFCKEKGYKRVCVKLAGAELFRAAFEKFDFLITNNPFEEGITATDIVFSSMFSVEHVYITNRGKVVFNEKVYDCLEEWSDQIQG